VAGIKKRTKRFFTSMHCSAPGGNKASHYELKRQRTLLDSAVGTAAARNSVHASRRRTSPWRPTTHCCVVAVARASCTNGALRSRACTSSQFFAIFPRKVINKDFAVQHGGDTGDKKLIHCL